MKMILSALVSGKSRSVLLLLPLLAGLLGGCAGTDEKGLYDPLTDLGTSKVSVARLVIGDTLIVTCSAEDIPIHDEVIKEDGYITLQLIGKVKAAGRTIGELQDAIHDAYVPKYYMRLTTTVKTGDRVFFMRGEVKQPGRLVYTGPITLTKAIASAGDFTETANPKKIVLTRAAGQRYNIDCKAILDGKKPDPEIYPGDVIEVKTKTF